MNYKHAVMNQHLCILETIYNDIFEKTKEVDISIQGLDLIPTYLIKDTNMMEFAKTIILLVVTTILRFMY